jgi:hypothetical protein
MEPGRTQPHYDEKVTELSLMLTDDIVTEHRLDRHKEGLFKRSERLRLTGTDITTKWIG